MAIINDVIKHIINENYINTAEGNEEKNGFGIDDINTVELMKRKRIWI